MASNFILYLLYGLAFFTLGVAILSREIRLSELGIARILGLLAAFGLIHGFHEWLVLLELLNPERNNPSFSLLLLVCVDPLHKAFMFYDTLTIWGHRVTGHTLLTLTTVCEATVVIS